VWSIICTCVVKLVGVERYPVCSFKHVQVDGDTSGEIEFIRIVRVHEWLKIEIINVSISI